MPIGLSTAALAGAGLAAAGTIGGSLIASNAQRGSVRDANATQLGMYDRTRADLAPYIQGGVGALGTLGNLTGANGGNPLTSPLAGQFAPTMDWLENTPGYKFSLDQGLKATQNSYAAKGLGSSGAAIRGAADYAEGLAGTTFQQQFKNYLDQNLQTYNMLMGQTQLGANAAAGMGGFATNTGNAIGQNTIGAGNAAGAAAINAGNAVGNAPINALLYSRLSQPNPGQYSDYNNNYAGGLNDFGGTVPGLAAGGHAEGRQPYVVGEKGPELFVPDEPGTVIPNHLSGTMPGISRDAGGRLTWYGRQPDYYTGGGNENQAGWSTDFHMNPKFSMEDMSTEDKVRWQKYIDDTKAAAIANRKNAGMSPADFAPLPDDYYDNHLSRLYGDMLEQQRGMQNPLVAPAPKQRGTDSLEGQFQMPTSLPMQSKSQAPNVSSNLDDMFLLYTLSQGNPQIQALLVNRLLGGNRGR